MADLHQYPAHICPTAAAVLIHEGKVLLVKHKKLKIWLAPGGHLEPGELPHETAERECREETGITVKAISPFGVINSSLSQYLPVPIVSNLHWVSKSNYLARVHGSHPQKWHTTKLWPKGCEQHLGMVYLVTAVGTLDLHHDPNESTAIGWFTKSQLAALDTLADVKEELKLAIKVSHYE